MGRSVLKSVRCLFPVLAMTIIMCQQIRSYAEEEVLLPTVNEKPDIVSIELPVISDVTEYFDFILDPQGLINATNAVRYGERKFEEGATVYFKNTDGDYDFSAHSEMLTIKNMSTVPVQVKVTAWIQNFESIQLTVDDDFANEAQPSLYIAVYDDRGEVFPLESEGRVVIIKELEALPDDSYCYQYDANSGKYIYELLGNRDEIEYSAYSFGLTGGCNPNGNWADVSVEPIVKVMWEVVPVLSEEHKLETGEFANASFVTPEEQTDDSIGNENNITQPEEEKTNNLPEEMENGMPMAPVEEISRPNEEESESLEDATAMMPEGEEPGGAEGEAENLEDSADKALGEE